MRKFLILMIFSALFSACGNTKKLNVVAKDKTIDQKILLGECTRDGFEKRQFKTWFQDEYMQYMPDEKIVEALSKSKLYETEITIVLATWCSDSRREVPRFYKILDQTNYRQDKIKMFALNKSKQSGPDTTVTADRVPTFIFSSNGVEIGRIIESPKTSLENDMLELLK